jgi:nucleoside-diphosphate-sugar epimerase
MVNAGRNVKAVRLALGYGPGFKIDDKRVMYEFAFAAIRNRKIKMKDRGQALRTYGHAHDISEMMFNILLRAKQSCYNVGGKSRFSILELANIIADRTGATVEVPEVASSEEQIRNAPGDVWLDLDRYCNEFSKSEFVSIDRGIVDVIDWARMLIEQQ